MTPADLKAKANWLRRAALDHAVAAGRGHVTTIFSEAEILVVLFYAIINGDRFVLSKGHGFLGLKLILEDLGLSSRSDFCPATMGHGLPFAVGVACALRTSGNPARIYVLTGDAELQEGSNWEALTYASSAKLDNLTIIVDRNGMGVLGFTERGSAGLPTDGPSIEPLADRLQAFGCRVKQVDGHDAEALLRALDESSRPGLWAIICNTVKGKGSAVIERRRLWHWRVPAGADLEQIKTDLDAGGV